MPNALLVLLSSIQMEACGGKGLFGLPFAKRWKWVKEQMFKFTTVHEKLLTLQKVTI